MKVICELVEQSSNNTQVVKVTNCEGEFPRCVLLSYNDSSFIVDAHELIEAVTNCLNDRGRYVKPYPPFRSGRSDF